MITEDYVSFEIAKLLKEKGFDAEGVSEVGGFYVDYFRTGKSVGITTESMMLNKDLDYWEYLRPTLQMAMKWLREVHKLAVFPTTYYREINRNVKYDYGSTIVRLDTHEIIGNDKNIEDYTFEAETYEETAEKAIRYCLENLI